jgi:hypothetical protein
MSIWEFEEGCLKPSLLKVGDRLQVKSQERLFKVFGDNWKEFIQGDERGCLEYLLPEPLKPFDILIVQEIKQRIYDDSANYIPILFHDNDRVFWFICDDEDYNSDNITFNEMFDVLETN